MFADEVLHDIDRIIVTFHCILHRIEERDIPGNKQEGSGPIPITTVHIQVRFTRLEIKS